ncbi:MAG: LptF/LptG family permease [Spirochaetia bacterium]|nr:LptF/LptG family permease [Spirochaetia bacterium]
MWRRLEYFRGPRRFGPTILDRYVFVEIMVPFFVAVLFWTTLFMVVVLKDIVGELFGKSIELYKILGYIVYLLGEKITQTFPISCLFAGILAAGRLSGDSEITAMRSAGISFPRIYGIFISFGFFATMLAATMDFYYGPLCSRAREDFEDWLKAYHSLTLVKPGVWLGRANIDGVSKKGQDIYAENRAGSQLREVQIREWYNNLDVKSSETVRLKNVLIPIGDGFITSIVHAESGELLSRNRSDGTEEKFIRFRNGFTIEVDEKQEHYQVTSFPKGFMDYLIPPPVKPLGRLNVKPENYTYPELFEFLERLDKGGSEVPVETFLGGAGGGAAGGMSSVALGGGGGGSGQMIKIPSAPEMKKTLQDLIIWSTVNGPMIGKPGGPTEEDFQLRVRMIFQLQMFLKDVDKTRRKFQLEVQRRLASAAACMLFFFVAFPLGLVVKRSGKVMGFGLALIVCASYYVILLVSQSQAMSGSMKPWAGAWLPDIIVAGFGLYVMSTRTEGFAPFAFITRPAKRLYGKTLGRLLDPMFGRIYDLLHSPRILAGAARIVALTRRIRKNND